jgi:hypothetical protein
LRTQSGPFAALRISGSLAVGMRQFWFGGQRQR